MNLNPSRRSLVTGAAALAAYAALPGAADAGSMLLLGVGGPPAAGGGGGQTTTFNTSDASTYPVTFSNGDRTAAFTSSCTVIATALLGAGKVYWEWRIDVLGTSTPVIGVAIISNGSAFLGNYSGGNQCNGMDKGGQFWPGAPSADAGFSFTTGTVVGECWDGATEKSWFTTDGVNWYGSSGADDPVAGTGGMVSATPSGAYHAGVGEAGAGAQITLLAGSNITRSVPSGFTVLP